jgi:hypothetical protein
MRLVALTMLLTLSLVRATARGADKDEAPFFPLGLWYEGGVGDARDNVLPADPAAAAPVYEKNFADIASRGINVLTVPNSPPPHHKLVLDTAHKHGLKVILELDLDGGELGHMIRGNVPLNEQLARDTLEKKLGPIKDHPALWRVQLLDEPTDEAFPRYGKIADVTRQFDPQSNPFCCLVGIANGEAFLKHAKSDVIAFDTYPLAPQHKPGDARPLRDWAVYAARFPDWADGAVPPAASWAVLQCHEITGGLRFPTPAELRCMTYTALATGNRGVFWFLYQTERLNKDQVMSGLVDRDFKPRPLWDEIPKLIDEIKPLTPTLSNLRPERNIRLDVTNGAAWALRDAKLNTPYVFVVNFDTLKPQTVRVCMPLRNGVVTRLPEEEQLQASGLGGSIEWDTPLPPGAGKLFRVQ